MPSVGDGLNAQNANWSFGKDTAKNFDDHVKKSVPLYSEGHKLICDLSDFFVKKDSVVYDIGTSTGEVALKLSQHNSGKSGARIVGIDIEPDMIKLAEAKKAKEGIKNVDFVADDVLQYEFEPCDLVTSYYAIQFIRPSQRQDLFDKIYKSLKWGGAFIIFEKVRANDARFQDIATSLYNEYKLDQGYTPEEIFAKSRSLKGVLEPFSTQGNLDLMRRAGFSDVLTVMKYVCFEGFLAIK